MVNYIPPAPVDITPPTVTINSPTDKGSYRTKNAILNISGTASDDTGITQVTWSNDATGESGIASGLDKWSVPNISLNKDKNTIRIEAIDQEGNMGYATLNVFCR